MCLRFQFCTYHRVCILHFLKKVKFVVPYPTDIHLGEVFITYKRPSDNLSVFTSNNSYLTSSLWDFLCFLCHSSVPFISLVFVLQSSSMHFFRFSKSKSFYYSHSSFAKKRYERKTIHAS